MINNNNNKIITTHQGTFVNFIIYYLTSFIIFIIYYIFFLKLHYEARRVSTPLKIKILFFLLILDISLSPVQTR